MQTVGGGGGDYAKGGDAISKITLNSWAVGGTGSGGGDGGDIVIDNQGAIVTSGRGAIGIQAQSVGGGGGFAGDYLSNFKKFTQEINIGPVSGFSLDAGDGGDGGDVNIVSNAPITTSGELAHAISVSSIGGSGGQSGVSGYGVETTAGGQAEEVDCSGVSCFIGSAGDQGKGGSVDITVNDEISVTGVGAIGVVATSIAGGKDASSSNLSTSGDVAVTVNGTISASGNEGRALFLGSLSRNFSTDVFSGITRTGTVTLTVNPTGVVSTSDGEIYETVALLGGGDGGNQAAAKVINFGTITADETATSETRYVIRTEKGALDLENHGVVNGSIDVNTPLDWFPFPDPDVTWTKLANTSTGTFLMGDVVDLDVLSVFQNDGLISAGTTGANGIDRTEISVKTFKQSETGRYQVDLRFPGSEEGASDVIIFNPVRSTSSNDLQEIVFSGSVVPAPVNSNEATQGLSGEFRIIQSFVGTQTEDNIFSADELTVQDSAVVNYELKSEPRLGGNRVQLLYEVNYVPWEGFALGGYDHGLTAAQAERANDNVAALGGYIGDLVAHQNDVLGFDSEEAAQIKVVVNHVHGIGTATNLLDLYETWTPQIATAPLNTALYSAIGFANSLQGCPRYDQTGRIAGAGEERGSCVWSQVGGGSLQRQSDSSTIGYTENSFGVEGGMQIEVGDNLFAGAAFLFEDSNLKSDTLSSGGGKRYQGGLVMRKEHEAWTFSGAVTGGVSDYSLSRSVQSWDGTRIASSSPTSSFVTGRARVAHTFVTTPDSDGPKLYLKPTSDVGFFHQWQGAYQETGAGALGVRFESASQTFAVLNPFVEAGSTMSLLGLPVSAYARAGVLSVLGGDQSLDASFVGVPDGGPTFTVSEDVSRIQGDLGFGIQVEANQGLYFKLEGNTLLAGNQQSYFGSGRVGYRF